MKRFTQKCNGKTGVALTFDLDIKLPNMEQVERLQDMIIRLAAYEDTGLTPEEIATLKSERDVAVKAVNEAVKYFNCSRCVYSGKCDMKPHGSIIGGEHHLDSCDGYFWIEIDS
jgi:hypothetical protein